MNYRQYISFTAGMRASGLPSSLSDPEEHKRIKRRPDEFKKLILEDLTEAYGQHKRDMEEHLFLDGTLPLQSACTPAVEASYPLMRN
ncbi:hypothetical protein D4764_19G0009190 [Takifugu flavidus]|uniref:Uncharacterized protein n=1 Tax=Takifugu flavidus TaxID=433684 RepID=A0A5C6NSQ3_9TELE|nr:hypothetical protein D4764_19G0009190 [Takifugu flavidus]